VETTTGPLGQGITNAVGFALAEKVLAAEFNRPGHEIVNHHTYTFLGDGCLMEGISHEACSLAGTLGLGKLIAFWDDNGISIDGHVEGWFTDNTPKRFEAYGWHVIADVNGHNSDAIERALLEAKSVTDKPSLICCKTTIGAGAPNKQGSHDCHGAPLGKDEIAAAREYIGWTHPPFEIPAEIYTAWDGKPRGATFEENWHNRFKAYRRLPRRSRRIRAPCHQGRSCLPTGKQPRPPTSLPAATRPRTSPRARLRRTRSQRWCRRCRKSSAARPTWPAPT
jgi:transketolase